MPQSDLPLFVQARSKWVMNIIMDSIGQTPPEQLHNLLFALRGMLEIKDSLQQWRIATLLSSKGIVSSEQTVGDLI